MSRAARRTFRTSPALASLRGRLAPEANAFAMVAVVIVGAWNALTDRGTTTVGIPTVGGWLTLAAAFAAGAGMARAVSRAGAPESRRQGIVALAIAAVVGIVAVFLVFRGLHRSRLAVELLFAAGTAAMALGGAYLGRRWPNAPIAGLLLIGEVAAIWALHDAAYWAIAHHFYDLHVYLAAGVHERLGQPVYLPAPLTALPSSAATDFFLYPPPLIPVMVVASHVSADIVGPLFAVLMAACAVLGFRLLGLSWAWSVLLLAFPPLNKGMESGNVANLTFLLYVAAFRYGAAVAIGSLFKVQNVIPAAWLVRERRWRDIAVGVGVLVIAAAVTLPFVGLGAWGDWIAGLGYRQQSQVNVPILYGLSPALILPPVLFAGVAVALVLVALAFRGRRGLAGLGLASIVASPSLWPHGFVMALPALLALPMSPLVWLALGLGAGGAIGLWLMAALAAAAILLRSWDETSIPRDALHPLGGTRGPWPAAEVPL